MTSCKASCTDVCIEAGSFVLKEDIKAIILGALGTGATGMAIYNNLSDAFTSIKCTFPINVKDRLVLLLTLISSESATLVKDVLIFSIIVIFFTVLLLIIFIYLTFFIFTPFVMGLFFVLSFLIIIAAVIILYVGVLNIYNTAHDNIDKLITDIETLLNDVLCAGKNGLCCLGTTVPIIGHFCRCIACPT